MIGICGFLLSSCGTHGCGVVDRFMNEPGCRSYALDARRVPIGGSASCAGTSFSRKVRMNCTPGSGSFNQCSSALSGGILYVLLVANNAGGSFQDSTGILYATCGSLWQDFFAGSIESATAFYQSSTTIPGDTVTCDDSTGCTLNPSESCFSGWLAGIGPSGTASLPNGTSLLACVYIDNSSQPASPAPPSLQNWNTDPLLPLSISGDPTFTTGWRDAY
ncbi:MAG: hypothetical protein H7301_05100 [Cryobacterium sp.]|nr:hypothetical protein [Oligoflexia bacterium]